MEWTGWMFALPPSLNIVMLVLVMAGLTDDRCPSPFRVAAARILGWFAIAGKPFDHYWGLIAAPVWLLCSSYGANRLLRALAVLVQPVDGRSPRSNQGTLSPESSAGSKLS